MQTFATSHEAKQFLVNKIAEQAEHEGAPLSDTERDMLYFSETHWSLPNIMDVSEAFDREYDSEAYEEKIAALIEAYKARAKREKPANLKRWKEALTAWKDEDHYLLVMMSAVNTTRPTREPVSPLWYLKASLIGAAVFGVILFVMLMIRASQP